MLLHLAADWATISSLATAGGTLVLALATFASVRSANRSARVAEAALQEQRRPLLAQSRFDDPVQKIMFVEGRWVKAEGGRAVALHGDGTVYLAINLRNVGSGIGVCQGWTVRAGFVTSRTMPTHTAVEEFRAQSRDLYIPAGDVGMWQGALRNPDDPVRAELVEAIETREPISVELLYSDQVGGQRTITRFGLTPTGDTWIASVNRHWYLDWTGPRAESELNAAVEAVLHDREAAVRRAEADLAHDNRAAAGDGGGPAGEDDRARDLRQPGPAGETA
jgi:hypothetical protein